MEPKFDNIISNVTVAENAAKIRRNLFPQSKRIQKMEIWDVFNKDGKPTGRTVPRKSPILRKGEYHLVVHIWTTDGRGNLLIQKRSESKTLMPGQWAATGGAAVAGEDSRTAAVRELKEELGIEKCVCDLKLLKRITRRNSFVDVYLTKARVLVNTLSLQLEEVAEARWVSPDCLKRMIERGEFHDYGKAYFETLFAALENWKESQDEQAT